MPRRHKKGAITCWPGSNAGSNEPPPSTTRTRPCGSSTTQASPWPTSRKVAVSVSRVRARPGAPRRRRAEHERAGDHDAQRAPAAHRDRDQRHVPGDDLDEVRRRHAPRRRHAGEPDGEQGHHVRQPAGEVQQRRRRRAACSDAATQPTRPDRHDAELGQRHDHQVRHHAGWRQLREVPGGDRRRRHDRRRRRRAQPQRPAAEPHAASGPPAPRGDQRRASRLVPARRRERELERRIEQLERRRAQDDERGDGQRLRRRGATAAARRRRARRRRRCTSAPSPPARRSTSV